MPSRACLRCGAPRPLKGACPACGHDARPRQRAYRGLAGYRRMRDVVLSKSDVCHLCGRPGADTIDHVIPYADQDPTTRDDPSTWQEADFRPAHALCNRQRGRRPLA